MDERNVELFAARLSDAAIAADDHDVGAGVEELVGVGGDEADEVVCGLDGTARVTIGGDVRDVSSGVALFVPRGTAWSAEGDARGVSVLVHEPEPASRYALIDLDAVEKATATAGRELVLGVTPAPGCASVTPFIGLLPPGRPP